MDHAFKVAPGKKVRLDDYDPNANHTVRFAPGTDSQNLRLVNRRDN